jgi:hypothetical protein
VFAGISCPGAENVYFILFAFHFILFAFHFILFAFHLSLFAKFPVLATDYPWIMPLKLYLNIGYVKCGMPHPILQFQSVELRNRLRMMLLAVPSLKMAEMDRNKQNTLCCGGGNFFIFHLAWPTDLRLPETVPPPRKLLHAHPNLAYRPITKKATGPQIS